MHARQAPIVRRSARGVDESTRRKVSGGKRVELYTRKFTVMHMDKNTQVHSEDVAIPCRHFQVSPNGDFESFHRCKLSCAFCSRHSHPSLYSHDLIALKEGNEVRECFDRNIPRTTYLHRFVSSMSTPFGGRFPYHQSKTFATWASRSTGLYLNTFFPITLDRGVSTGLTAGAMPSCQFSIHLQIIMQGLTTSKRCRGIASSTSTRN